MGLSRIKMPEEKELPKEQKKIFTVTPMLFQIYQRKWGMFASSILGSDIYYLKEYIDLAINEIGEENFVKLLKEDDSENKSRTNQIGNNWEKVKISLNKFDVLLNKTKGFYDKLEDKAYKKVNEKNIKDFLKQAKRIPLIKQDIYTLAVFLVRNTSLRLATIPPEAFKVLDLAKYQKMDFTKRPIGQTQESHNLEVTKE